MGAILLATFVCVPIIEIVLFIEVGGRIGLGPTISVVVLTAFAGTFLLRQQGLATLRRAQASLEENRFPLDEVFDGLCLVGAGAKTKNQKGRNHCEKYDVYKLKTVVHY